MSYKRISLLVSALVMASLVLTSCGASSGAAGFPTGKFVSTSDSHVGYYFNEDKTWSYFYYGEIGAEGKYSVKGNQWTEKGVEGECPFPGTYEWTFDGSNLSFKLVGEDKCDPRRESTDGQSFTLVK